MATEEGWDEAVDPREIPVLRARVKVLEQLLAEVAETAESISIDLHHRIVAVLAAKSGVSGDVG